MKHSLIWIAIAATVAVVAGLGSISTFAQQNLEAAVKQRQDAMKENGNDFYKVIKDYLDGKGDQAKAVASAKELLVVAGKLGDMWPPGTSSAEMVNKTRAKPEIWQQMDKFTAILAALKVEEQKLLAALEKGDGAGGKVAYQDVDTKGCTACHDLFRGPRLQTLN